MIATIPSCSVCNNRLNKSVASPGVPPPILSAGSISKIGLDKVDKDLIFSNASSKVLSLG